MIDQTSIPASELPTSGSLGWGTLMLTVIATILGSIFYVIQKSRQPKYVSIGGQIKRLPPGSYLGKHYLFGIGETVDLILNSFNFINQRIQKHGDVCYTSAFGHDNVLLSGSNALSIFYNEDVIKRHGAYPLHVVRLLGSNQILMMLDGDEHNKKRVILEKAFKDADMINKHIKTIERVIDKQFDRWIALNHFDWVKEFELLSAEIATSVLFNKNDGDLFVNHLRCVIQGLSSLPINLAITNYGRALRSRKILNDYYSIQIDNHIDRGDINLRDNDKIDTLKMIIDECKGTDITLHDITMDIHYLVISFYSLFNLFSSCIVAMDSNHDVMEKLKLEIRNINPDEPVSIEHIYKLSYLGLFIKEVRRYFPSVPYVYGKVNKDFDINGYHVPQGWNAIACLYSSNHSNKDYSDSIKFIPERFDSEPHSGLTYGFVPQGGGSIHRCVGEDLTYYILATFLIKLIKHYSWELQGGQDFKYDNRLFIPKPQNGIQVHQFYKIN